MDHCGITLVESLPGRARVRADVVPPLTTSRGSAHGGLLMTMLDVAMGHATRDSAEGAISFLTIDLQVGFMGPGNGRLVAEGRVVRPGRNIVFCEGDVRDEEGSLIAKATGVFRPVFPK
jgi:uncharacterized protein (TIGR00369 family)